jgi:cyclopropane fatty-acyl-phospholipid synthase-like methyltransferase
MSNGKGEINIYGRQLSPAEIGAKMHRAAVGGMWEEIGLLQFRFLTSRGLLPGHTLLDVGCGALRGGVHFVRYLDAGHYHGLDINPSLIEAGRQELREAGLTERKPNLLVNDKFEASRFGVRFDYAMAQSVFTHLPMNHIVRCLVEVGKVLKPEGVFFATFFEAPSNAYLAPLPHHPGQFVTTYDADPFHYSFDEFEWMARTAGLRAELIGAWAHPRDQRMLVFSREG